MRSCNVRNLDPEKAEGLSPELQRALQPLLVAIEELSERIVEYNDQIEALVEASYPQVALLKQIKGVGTLIALTFLLTLEDPHRFGKSRDVGGYLGLHRAKRFAPRECGWKAWRQWRYSAGEKILSNEKTTKFT